MSMLLVLVLCAADTSQWSAVRELKKGDRVGVVQSDMKRVEGRFDIASDDGITIDGVMVSKDHVVRVYRRPRMNRGLRAVVGGAIGLAMGAVVDGTAGTYMRNESSGPDPGLITGIGAAAGAGIGAASGGGYKTVYQKR
jgi:hypothetical protein